MDSIRMATRLGGGHFLDELHAALLRVADEVIATGKQGSVNVTLKVTKPQAAEPVITVSESIGVKLPASEPQGSFFYVADSQLHTKDPRQAEMDFRVVGGSLEASERSADDAGEVREATE